MFIYIVRRLLQLIPLLLVFSLLTFGIFQLQPGDPIKSFVDRSLLSDPAEVERARHRLGLDQPWYVQYVKWLGHLVQGDMGRSFITNEPVAQTLGRAIPVSLKLNLWSFFISFSLAILIGVLSATRRYSLMDHITTLFSFAGIAIPTFWLGILTMLLFSVKLKWLPATGMYSYEHKGEFLDTVKHMIMPVFVLSVGQIAATSRYVRSSLLEVLRLDYIRTARSKGLSERVVIYRHALRNALMPVITFLGLNLAGFIGGSLIVENIFGWPGMGRAQINGVFQKDYPIVLGANTLFFLLTVIGNLIADVMYAVVDPRVKFS